MIELRPKIDTLPKALKYIGQHPKAAFLKHVVSGANPSADNSHSSYVLAGGSRSYPVSVSLTHSRRQIHRNDSLYRNRSHEHRRLVIKDGLYRTRYAIDSVEYADILKPMEGFAREKGLSLINPTDHNG